MPQERAIMFVHSGGAVAVKAMMGEGTPWGRILFGRSFKTCRKGSHREVRCASLMYMALSS